MGARVCARPASQRGTPREFLHGLLRQCRVAYSAIHQICSISGLAVSVSHSALLQPAPLRHVVAPCSLTVKVGAGMRACCTLSTPKLPHALRL